MWKVARVVLGFVAMILAMTSVFVDVGFNVIFLVLSIGVLALNSILSAISPEQVSRPVTYPQVQPQPSMPMPEPPLPPPPPKLPFVCKYCQKPFTDEKKLRRHIGMAHLDMIQI